MSKMSILGRKLVKTAKLVQTSAAHDLKLSRNCTIFIKSALFSRFGENFRPVWWFWELWRSKMRFGQNVLRMTWKKPFCTIFMVKRTVFPFWRELQASVTILRTLTLKNAIWPKRAAHDLKRAFCTIFMESALFSRFEENLRPVWRFWELWRSKIRFGQNVLSMTWKSSVLYNFHGKRTVFPFWREFEASVTILRTLTLKNAIWPKRAPHDLKRAFCTIFMESALFSLFEENLRLAWRFWKLWRSKMRFGQNVLRMTWKKSVLYTIFMESALFSRFEENFRPVWRFWELWRSKMRFGQNVLRMTWKVAFCTIFMESALFSRFEENLEASFTILTTLTLHKSDLAKRCCAWPEKSVLYNFQKRTVFPSWREFEASVTILRTLTLKNAIWPKGAAHDLKRAFCTIFMESALFSPFWKLIWGQCDDFENFHAQKMRFGQNVLRMTWKERFVQFSWESALFSRFEREFQASVTIFRALTLKNAIWPKRAAHDLKRAFCTIFMESALFSVLARISDKCDHFENFDA